MGHGHGHGHGAHRAGEDDVHIERAPRLALLALIAAAAVATVVGFVLLWPDSAAVEKVRGQASFAAPGVTFTDASVISGDAEKLSVEVDSGPYDGRRVTVQVPPEVARSGLSSGDTVRLIITPGQDGEAPRFSYFGTERSTSLWLLGALFVLVVGAVARLRGLLAILGLGFGLAVIWWFVLPALLIGSAALPVGLTGSAAIMLVVLYTTHGFSLRTSAALVGTLAGLAMTAALAWWAIDLTHLTGISDESGGVLAAYAGQLSFQGLLTCAMIIAGLGVLNDVTITQASSVWELRAASPSMSRLALFSSGMRIGRDHIASTIYTIAFAYAGAALTVLLVIQIYAPPLAELMTTEEIAQEVVRTLVSSIGLVLVVPLTTAIAVLTVPGRAGEHRGGDS